MSIPGPLRKTLKLFLVVFLLILVTGVLLFKTPLILERLGPAVLNVWLPYRYPGCQFKIIRLSIDEKIYRFPEDVVLNNLDMVFKLSGEEYHIGCRQAEIQGLTVLLGADKIMRMNILGASILASAGRLSNMDLKFLYHETIIDYTRGLMTGARLEVGPYELQDMKSRIFIYPGQVVFEPFSATLYGGSVAGKITLDYRYASVYSLRIKLAHVDLKQLEAVNPVVFSQVRGLLDGEMTVDGVRNKIRSLNSSFEIKREGSLKAVLLSPLLSSLPPGINLNRLEDLIKSGGYLDFSEGRMQVERTNSQSLRMIINLQSQHINLADTRITVNLDTELGEGLRIFLQSIPGK